MLESKKNSESIENDTNLVKNAGINVGGNFESLVLKSSVQIPDKSLFIKEIIEDDSEVLLITMPRRWGKSCNLDMLERFLSIPVADDGTLTDIKKTTNYKLFFGNQKALKPLKITKAVILKSDEGTITQESIDYYYAKHPVIRIDFKNCKGSSLEEVEEGVIVELQNCFEKHAYLTSSTQLNPKEKEIAKKYIEATTLVDLTAKEIKNGLKFLSKLLFKHYGKKVWLLIDEYDAAANKAYRELDKKTTNSIVNFFRELFETSLKGNESHLYKGLLTGVQYIAQSGMLSGLNNLTKYNITKHKYAQYYGLTQLEFKDLTDQFGLSGSQLEGVKDWYNGYQLQSPSVDGKIEYIDKYNIWSVVNYLNNTDSGLVSYWEKSGSIDFIRQIFKQNIVKDKIEALIDGKSTVFTLKTDFSVDDFKALKEITYLRGNQAITRQGINVLFSYFFITGYLTIGDKGGLYKFPNKEIKYEMGNKILEYYETIYNIDSDKIYELSNSLQRIFDGNEAEKSSIPSFIKNTFVSEFFPKFQEIIDSCKLVNDKTDNEGIFANEDVVHSILNYIGLQTIRTKFATEVYTDKLGAKERGRADILICNKKTGLIIEVKYGKDSSDAKDQATSYEKLINHLPEQVYIGISVSDKKKVSLSGEIRKSDGSVDIFEI